MKEELDELLCKKYPKMMINRNKSMMETCMCWGFEVGNGWFNLLDQLMGDIQHHINWKRNQRAQALQYNRCLKRAVDGDRVGLIWYYTFGDSPTEYTFERVESDLEEPKFRDVPEKIHQVTLDQVKEKFGTLRFYYSGGDDYISGMVTLAESMSGVMCETCGGVAKTIREGWHHTTCQSCQDARDKKKSEFVTDSIKNDIL